MGYATVLDNATGASASGQPGITDAARRDVETATYVVASSAAAPVTITDGNVLSLDLTSYGGSLRSNIVKNAATTADLTVGVATETFTIPQTTAAGDVVRATKVMRRGFHPAVNVATGGAVGSVVVPSATAGRGTAVAVAAATAPQAVVAVAVMYAAAAANLCPCWVQAQH